jgi:hypothetical protein
MLYLFLVGKLWTPALNGFHNNTTYMDFGFEMLDHLRQTYAPQPQSDIYTNFLGLISLDMGPKDMLGQMVAQIQKYAVALSAGSVKVPPPLLSMIFMKSLNDRTEVLKQNLSSSLRNTSIYQSTGFIRSPANSLPPLNACSPPPSRVWSGLLPPLVSPKLWLPPHHLVPTSSMWRTSGN